MRDKLLYNARRLFAEFRQAFADREGQRNWWLTFDDDEAERMGMSGAELAGAEALLTNKGLIEAITSEGVGLTDAGYDVCLYPETLDEILGPPRGVTPNVVHVTGETVVLGNNNVVDINTTVLVQNLMDHLAKDSSVSGEARKRWVDALKDIGAHLAAAATKVVLDRVGLPGS